MGKVKPLKVVQWDQPLSWYKLTLTSALLDCHERRFSSAARIFSETHMKNSCVPLYFNPQAGARAVMIQEANGRSGHRNLMAETFKMAAFSAKITARLKVCNAVCKDEHRDMKKLSLPLHSLSSLVTRGRLCCFYSSGHGDCCSMSCLYHQGADYWENEVITEI